MANGMNVTPSIRVAPDAEQLAWQAAERFVRSAEEAIIATGRFAVGLSGGSTPQILFRLLSSDAFASKVDWSRVHVLFVDERCVPADHPDSNFGVACRLLLDPVQIPYENIHRLVGEKEPQLAADEYDSLLKHDYDKGLDLVILGMGSDGHTASLFPDTDALQATGRFCVANYVPQLSAWRLTLTADYINKAFEVMLLISGRAKAELVNRALEGFAGAAQYPVHLIHPDSGRYVWMLDAQAAGMDSDDAG